MGYSKEQWIGEVERCQEDFGAGNIDVVEFRERMRLLGFDPDEVEAFVVEVLA